jgi:hypothetical protein
MAFGFCHLTKVAGNFQSISASIEEISAKRLQVGNAGFILRITQRPVSSPDEFPMRRSLRGWFSGLIDLWVLHPRLIRLAGCFSLQTHTPAMAAGSLCCQTEGSAHF